LHPVFSHHRDILVCFSLSVVDRTFARMELGSFLARLWVLCIFIATALATNAVHVLLLMLVKPFSGRIYHQLVQYNNWTFMARESFSLR
jgi:hypothetical protein